MMHYRWVIGFAAFGLLLGAWKASGQTAASGPAEEAFEGDPVAAYFKRHVDAAGGLEQAQQRALPQSGELAKKCMVCHGEDGSQTGQMKKVVVPNIASQQPLYLFKQLWNLRSGARSHPVMEVMAQGMSDDELLMLALRFSALPLVPYQGPRPTANPQVGAGIYRDLCVHCHGEDASGVAAIPRLKGQNPVYVVNTLISFRDGGLFRTHAGMAAITSKLGDEEIASIAAFLVDF